MDYEIQTERVTSLHTELCLTKDKTETMAKLILQYRKDKGELHIKEFRSNFSGEFMRTTGKTPADVLFEYALTQYPGTAERNLLVLGNLQRILDARSLSHYVKSGVLKALEGNTWEVNTAAAQRLKVQTEF